MMLTPKDQRTVLDALDRARDDLYARIAECPTADCVQCDKRSDQIVEYDALAARIREAQP